MKDQDIGDPRDSAPIHGDMAIEEVDESWALALLDEESSRALSEELSGELSEEVSGELTEELPIELASTSSQEADDLTLGSDLLIAGPSGTGLFESPMYSHANSYQPGSALSAIQVQQITFNQLKKFNAEAEARACLIGRNWLARLIALFTGRFKPKYPKHLPGRRY